MHFTCSLCVTHTDFAVIVLTGACFVSLLVSRIQYENFQFCLEGIAAKWFYGCGANQYRYITFCGIRLTFYLFCSVESGSIDFIVQFIEECTTSGEQSIAKPIY